MNPLVPPDDVPLVPERPVPGRWESSYLWGWGALFAALAVAGGLVLYALTTSLGGDGGGKPAGQAVAAPSTPPASTTPPAETSTPAPAAPAPTAKPVPSAAAPPPTPGKRPRPSPSPKPPRVRGVKMTSPVQGQRISGRAGFTIRGTAGDLGGRALRVFDHADNGFFYLVDGSGVPVRGSRWSLRYRDIGGDGQDIGKTFVITAVTADASCQRVLNSTAPNGEGDRPFSRLPPGCRIVDQVGVLKTAP